MHGAPPPEGAPPLDGGDGLHPNTSPPRPPTASPPRPDVPPLPGSAAQASGAVAAQLSALQNAQRVANAAAVNYERGLSPEQDATNLAILRAAQEVLARLQGEYDNAVLNLMRYASAHPEILRDDPSSPDAFRTAFLSQAAGLNGLAPRGIHDGSNYLGSLFFNSQGQLLLGNGDPGGVDASWLGSSYDPDSNTISVGGGAGSGVVGSVGTIGTPAGLGGHSQSGPGGATLGFGQFVNTIPNYPYAEPGSAAYESQGQNFIATLANIRFILANATIVGQTNAGAGPVRSS